MPSVKLPEVQGAVKRWKPTYCAAPSGEGDVSLTASAGERGTAAMKTQPSNPTAASPYDVITPTCGAVSPHS
jgi:hypothetical protein